MSFWFAGPAMPRLSALFRSVVLRASCRLLPVLAVTLLAGCPPETPESSATETEDESEQATAAKRLASCERQLSGALNQLSPLRIGFENDPETELADLEGWRKSCAGVFLDGGVEAVVAADSNDPALRAEKLPEPLQDAVGGEAYGLPDIQHITDSLLAAAITEQVASRQNVPDKAEAARRLFDFTVREIVAVPGLGGGVPVSPGRVWEMGLGTQSDQSWLFIQLLRQRRIDAAVLSMPVQVAGPNGQPVEASYQIIGAVVGDEPGPESVALFDFTVDAPLPSPSDPAKTATLAEALADDAVFRQYDLGGRRHPLTSELLKRRTVLFAGEPSLLAPRLGLIQAALPPEVTVELYESLGQSELSAVGLVERLATAMEVSPDAVALWTHSIVQARPQPSPAVAQLLLQRQNALAAPIEMRPNEQGQIAPQPARRPLRYARLLHLTGGRQKAVEAYLKPQVSVVSDQDGNQNRSAPNGLPPEVEQQRQAVNQLAAVDARYWTALLQAELGNTETAIRKLETFLDRDGRTLWFEASRRELARQLAGIGQNERAIEVMKGLQGPRPGDLWMLKQLGAEIPTTAELQAAQEEARQKAEAAAQEEAQKRADAAAEKARRQMEANAKKESEGDKGDEGESDDKGPGE